ncbi:cupin domain-containing protein [Siccirubricoccus deserti]|uniref:Cupin domain-containing protein n=2 Tax=Siccirubricoccus deserti TaxID=2013562 RepID=A0A9X0R0R0_9PROT|nr:cupin domain-containing protein [Siccirubricoccus deserti]
MEAPSGKVVRIGTMELRFLVDETQGSGDLVMFEFAVPANARVPAPHYHRDVDEAVYGLEGTLTMTVDGKRQEVRPGDAAFIPRGSVHHHENLHEGTARVLIVLTPGSIGRRYFEEVAEAVNVPGRPDPAQVTEVMLRHGLIPA